MLISITDRNFCKIATLWNLLPNVLVTFPLHQRLQQAHTSIQARRHLKLRNARILESIRMFALAVRRGDQTLTYETQTLDNDISSKQCCKLLK
jgi:hypothetical protein